jgi:hypothetical protein
MCANTPTAKDRVKRAHGTLQDRLVKEMRLEGISTIAGANSWIDHFLRCYIWWIPLERTSGLSASE